MNQNATTKQTLALVLPDGITLRNFVFSSFLKQAVEKFRVVVFHFVDQDVFNDIDIDIKEQLTFHRIDTYREFPIAKIYRYAKQKASLEINYSRTRNSTLLRNYPTYKHLKFIQKIPFIVANMLALHATQKRVERLDRMHMAWVNLGNKKQVTHYKNLLAKEGVDIVFNVHQRDVKSLPIVLAAKKLKIKTVNFVYSWDNLPKGRMAVPTDHYFVWSKYMKEEMNLYYPDISSNRITITGTPQFEFYHTYKPLSREEFARKYGLNPKKGWILYSGDMTDASPFDQHYLQDVYDEWQKSSNKHNTQILFRRAPTDLTGRFEKVLLNCPEIVNIEPLWRNTKGHQMGLIVSKADVFLLVNLIEHCYSAINFGSTMAHDFAQRSKRVYYLNYDHPSIKSDTWTSGIFYNYSHFETLKGLDPVDWIYSKEEIEKVFTVNEAKDERIKFWHDVITEKTEKAASSIVENLHSLSL